MTELLPIIEQLADAKTDAERADWLLHAPFSILLTYQLTIGQRLRYAGFTFGADYLDVVLAYLRSVRFVAKHHDFHSDLNAWTGGLSEIKRGASAEDAHKYMELIYKK